MATYEEKQKLKEWEEYCRDIASSTPVEVNMTEAEKAKKKIFLEAHPIEWIKYFFPKYTKYPFAKFQIKAINRILEHDEWFEVLSWSRENAKSTIVMFCVMYLHLPDERRMLSWQVQPKPVLKNFFDLIRQTLSQTEESRLFTENRSISGSGPIQNLFPSVAVLSTE